MQGMHFSRLYPLPYSSAGAWKTEAMGYQFLLLRSDSGWHLSCLEQGMDLLLKYDLLRHTYPTRKEAVQCLEGMLLSRVVQSHQDSNPDRA